jgi:hypothetical protein
MMQESIEGLARSTAEEFISIDERFNGIDERFDGVDERFDRLEVRFQNQIDAIAERKVDRSEFAPIQATVRNLRTA